VAGGDGVDPMGAASCAEATLVVNYICCADTGRGDGAAADTRSLRTLLHLAAHEAARLVTVRHFCQAGYPGRAGLSATSWLMRALRAGAASTIAIGLVATCLLGLLWYAVQQSERTSARKIQAA